MTPLLFTQDGPALAGLGFARLGRGDLDRLAHFCEDCSDFFELVEGRSGDEATAAEIIGALAPEHAHGAKHVFGLEKDGVLVGLAELLEGHPSSRDWYIGLLLLRPGDRRAGLGVRVCGALLDWIRRKGGTAARMVVQHQNPSARVFWERQGFMVERERTLRSGCLDNTCWVLGRDV